MPNAMVLHRNFLNADLLLGATKSSELVAAPATNVWDQVRRTRVWRSAGYFNITSANKTLIIRETTGVDLTATIVEAEYLTDATFLAAIKTALDAVGDSTYTVTRNSTTKLITIVSNGSGGGGIFQIRTADPLSTAASVLGFDTSGHRTGSLTYAADTVAIHTSEWMRWDLGTAVKIKAFAMCGTRKDGLKVSAAAVVTLQGNHTDSWSAPAYSQVLEYNEDCMAIMDTDGLDPNGFRYWRIEIVDPTNPLGYVEVSSMFLGEAIAPETGKVQFPFPMRFIDFSEVSQSEWGNKFGDERQVTREFSPEWRFLTVEEKEALEVIPELYKLVYPFWIALDPLGAFSSTPSRMVCPVFFENMPEFTLGTPGNFSSTWSLREAL